MRHVLAASAVLALSGCVTAYVPPPRVGNATLEFNGNSLPSSVFAMFTNGSDCSGKVGIPDENNFYKAGAKPLVIAANKEFAFTVFTTRGLNYCSVVTSFTPEPDGEYIAQATNNSNTCSIVVLRKREGTGGTLVLSAEPSQRQRTPKPSFSENGDFCQP